MSFDNALGLAAAVILAAFLIFVLVFPEKF
jgi:F subunit of K+-transporting ATPase (Potass_KdpF)